MTHRSIFFAFMLAVSPALAGAPTQELTEATAVRLINLQSRNHTPDVRVALIQEGTSKDGPFELTHVRRVSSIEPVPEDGSRVRRYTSRDFYWSDAYGWFLWEIRKERGGDAIWIWSELKGEVITR
jgi:hypothetical protein